MDPGLLEILCCPWCLGSLRHEEDRLTCLSCGAVYSIEDGTPNMLVEEAELHCHKCGAVLTIREKTASCDECGLNWSVEQRRTDM